jgi:hypothetical protein
MAEGDDKILTGEFGRRVSDLDLTEPKLAILVSQSVDARTTAGASSGPCRGCRARSGTRSGTGAFAGLATLGSLELRSSTVNLAKNVEQQIMLISSCHVRVEQEDAAYPVTWVL